MKHILKSPSPTFFKDWKQNFIKNEGREPTYDELRGVEYHRLKMHIIDEQYGLCCYCCKEIDHFNSHIEHFKPQSQYPDDALNYKNLLVSCDGYKGKHENCGHKKDNWYSDYYTVSPMDGNCESLFTYTVDGHIKANHDDTRARATIGNLELDSDLLQRARRSAIYMSGLFEDDFDNKRKQLIELFSTPEDGRLRGFCVAILYCLTNA